MAISFYINENGSEPAKEWIRQQDIDIKKKVGISINEVDKSLSTPPYTVSNKIFKKIKKNLWEIRVDNIRIFVSLFKAEMVILHIIIKKTNKIPKKEIEIAISRTKQLNS